MKALIRRRAPQAPKLFQNEMSEFFDRVLGDTLPWGAEDAMQSAFVPALDVSETNDNVIVKAEVPGMEAKDINITIKDDILTITGEKHQEKESKDETVHRVERTFGSFTRSLRLPVAVVLDKVAADYKAGILVVTMPKSEESRRREVKVRVG